MNKLNFNQSGGFGLKTQRLAELQTAAEIFNSLGYIAGDLTIISGCDENGASISDGRVFINGELFPFKAGFKSDNVIIIETPTSREFENGEIKDVHFERYVTFGTAEVSWPWEDFTRPMKTKDIAPALDAKEDKTTIANLIQRLELLEAKNAIYQNGGGMFFWNKPANQIPAGFAEVVNWRGRMPVGFDSTQTEFNAIGKVGGIKSVNIQKTHLPSGSYGWIGSIGTGYPDGSDDSTEAGAPRSFPKTAKQLVLGDNTPLPILNPYRTVMFIQWVGLP